MTTDESMVNDPMRRRLGFRYSSLGHSFDIRHSIFVILIFAPFLAFTAGSSCQPEPADLLPESESTGVPGSNMVLLTRIAQVTDTHVMDEQSPARFAGANNLVSGAWRPWESASGQILDGIIRAVNRRHASGERVDALIHTGDACDNAQHNELQWFLQIMDGGLVNPLSGPDDRQESDKPPVQLDPHAPFAAQGVYRQGVHGDSATIPWYALIGNHEVFAMGIFPMITTWGGARVAPLPLTLRPGLYLPTEMNPVGSWAYGAVTPANPGMPELFGLPAYVEPSPDRHYIDRDKWRTALYQTQSSPPGHGLAFAPEGTTWYSLTLTPGLRLVALDTADVRHPVTGGFYYQGAVSEDQRAYLDEQLTLADAAGEKVIVATHHPSDRLEIAYGSVLGPPDFRSLLNSHPSVILHIDGHEHANRVANRGGYLEIQTCSTIDWPQEGRIIEIWHDPATGATEVAYRMFSHTDEQFAPLGDDPLAGLRREVQMMAGGPSSSTARPVAGTDSTEVDDQAGDREGRIRIR